MYLCVYVQSAHMGLTRRHDAHAVSQFKADEGGIQACNDRDQPQPELYYIGIIDVV